MTARSHFQKARNSPNRTPKEWNLLVPDITWFFDFTYAFSIDPYSAAKNKKTENLFEIQLYILFVNKINEFYKQKFLLLTCFIYLFH